MIRSSAVLAFLFGFVLAVFLMLFTNARCAHAHEIVVASTYGDLKDIKRSGERLTSTGKPLDPNGNYVAHRTLPIGTRLTLSHGHRKLMAEVNDIGPFIRGRSIDLNPAVNKYLQCDGMCRVKIDSWPPLPKPRP